MHGTRAKPKESNTRSRIMMTEEKSRGKTINHAILLAKMPLGPWGSSSEGDLRVKQSRLFAVLAQTRSKHFSSVILTGELRAVFGSRNNVRIDLVPDKLAFANCLKSVIRSSLESLNSRESEVSS